MMNKFQIKLIKSFCFCCLKMEQLHLKTEQASVFENGAALFKNGASLKMEPNIYTINSCHITIPCAYEWVSNECKCSGN